MLVIEPMTREWIIKDNDASLHAINSVALNWRNLYASGNPSLVRKRIKDCSPKYKTCPKNNKPFTMNKNITINKLLTFVLIGIFDAMNAQSIVIVFYNYANPWKINFEIKSSAPKTVLDRFLNQS